MANISASFVTTSSLSISARNKQDTRASGEFDALLASAGEKLDAKAFASSLIENITLSMNQSLSPLFAKNSTKNAFPFSADFEATFGLSGPLIDFINATTSKLGLSAEQNLALQTIAVRNKDITKSPESVAKIGEELRQAGII